MPKMKTHRGLAKRVKVTGNGKVKRGSAYRSHNLGCKSQKQKRNLRKGAMVHDSNMRAVKKMLGRG